MKIIIQYKLVSTTRKKVKNGYFSEDVQLIQEFDRGELVRELRSLFSTNNLKHLRENKNPTNPKCAISFNTLLQNLTPEQGKEGREWLLKMAGVLMLGKYFFEIPPKSLLAVSTEIFRKIRATSLYKNNPYLKMLIDSNGQTSAGAAAAPASAAPPPPEDNYLIRYMPCTLVLTLPQGSHFAPTIAAIGKRTDMLEIEFCGETFSTKPEIIQFCNAISKNTGLKRISLTDVTFEKAAFLKPLLTAISSFPSLQELVITTQTQFNLPCIRKTLPCLQSHSLRIVHIEFCGKTSENFTPFISKFTKKKSQLPENCQVAIAPKAS